MILQIVNGEGAAQLLGLYLGLCKIRLRSTALYQQGKYHILKLQILKCVTKLFKIDKKASMIVLHTLDQRAIFR